MLAVTCLSVVVVALDLTILNIALPEISAALRGAAPRPSRQPAPASSPPAGTRR
jgi:hypothetical protein